MADIKRTLAQIADQVTDCLFKQAQVANHDTVAVLLIANETLVAIREQAQDALGEILDQEKARQEAA